MPPTRLNNELGAQASSSSLTASVQLAALDGNGSLVAPSSVRFAWVEIGCSDRDTLDEQLDKHAGAFLVSFEPQLDKYAVLLARGTTRAHGKRKDHSVRLGRHHERGVVLPIAVSPRGGAVPFRVQHVAGCSSIAKLNRRAFWAPWCTTPLETRTVPSITLSSALSLVPARLPIKLLKIDAQGVDFALIESAQAEALQRVQRVVLEVRANHCPPLYVGQPACEHVVAQMAVIGFANETACPFAEKNWWRHPNCERVVRFHRKSGL